MTCRKLQTFWICAGLMLVIVLMGFGSARAAEVVEFWSIHSRVEAWQDFVDRFNAANTDVQIDFTPVTPSEGASMLLAAAAAGSAPDLVYMDRGLIAEMKLTGVLADLNAYIDREGWDLQRKFFPGVLPSVEYQGGYYGVPIDAFPLTYLAWNKDHFNNAGLDANTPPETTAQLDQYHRRLTMPAAGEETPQIGFSPFTGVGTHFWLWSYLWGGHWWDSESERVVVDSPINRELIEWLSTYAQHLSDVAPEGWAGGRPPGNAFYDGHLSMTIASTSNIPQFEENMSYSWGIAPMPKAPGTSEHTLYVAGEGLAIPSGSTNKDAAWRVLTTFLQADHSVRYAKLVGIPPANEESVRLYLEETESTRMAQALEIILKSEMVVAPGYPPQRDIHRNVMNPALNAVRNLEQDPLTALAQAHEVASGVIAQYLEQHGPWW